MLKKNSDFPLRFQIFVPFKLNIKFSMTRMHHKSRSLSANCLSNIIVLLLIFLLALTSKDQTFWVVIHASLKTMKKSGR